MTFLKNFKEKLTSIVKEFERKKENRVVDKIRKRQEKIIKEYPELASTEYSNGVSHSLPLYEQFRTYHEIKGIKSQKIHNWVIGILAFVTVFTAIWFNVSPPMHKPNLELTTNLNNNILDSLKNNNLEFILFIYNGGDAPCMDLKLKYPYYFWPAYFKDYDSYAQALLEDNYSMRQPLKLVNFKCSYSECEKNLGFIEAGKVMSFSFQRDDLINKELPKEFKIEVSCNKAYDDITIKII